MQFKNLKTFIVYLMLTNSVGAITSDNNITQQPPFNTDRFMNDGNVDRSDANTRQKAFTTSKAQDSIKQCAYTENSICKILLRERMPTIIKLPEDEWVADFILGDELDFELGFVRNSSNKLLLKGLYAGIDTNLNIIGGSGLIYSFYILTESFESDIVSDFIVNINTSTQTQVKIADAKRFYKARPFVIENLSEIVGVNIINNSLHVALKKLLPIDWTLSIDLKIRNKNKLVSITSDSKTRKEVIDELLLGVNLKPVYYEKLEPKLLVVLEKTYVIK